MLISIFLVHHIQEIVQNLQVNLGTSCAVFVDQFIKKENIIHLILTKEKQDQRQERINILSDLLDHLFQQQT
jgi:hypothetical protein